MAAVGGLAFAWYEVSTGSAQAANFWQTIRASFSETVVRVATSRIGALAIFVLILEALVVGWRGSSIFRLVANRSRSAIIDMLYFTIMLLKLVNVLEVALTLGFSLVASRFITWVASNYGWQRIPLPSDGIAEIAVSLAVYWLATSFVHYWGHRLMHTPLFWHLHRFHHAATELNVLTVFRAHPLEPVVLSFLSIVSPLIFLKVPDRVLLIYFIGATVIDLLAHSQLPWGYGWVGRWVVQSPLVHQVHHSIDEEHRDLHFSMCPMWDHLFGTWYKGSKRPSGFGIPDPAYEVRPLTQFVIDACIFYKTLARWIWAPIQRLRVFTRASPSPK